MSDLTDRLRFPVSMSMFATKTDLYMEILQQRKEAADALEARDKTITELVEALKMTRATVGDLRKGFASYVRPDAWVEQLQSYIDSSISQAKSKDKAE